MWGASGVSSLILVQDISCKYSKPSLIRINLGGGFRISETQVSSDGQKELEHEWKI